MKSRIPTSLGIFVAHFSENGLQELNFPDRAAVIPAERSPAPLPVAVRQWEKLTITALKAVLAGRIPLNLPPLDLSVGTKFQQAVWREMLKIPAGKTKSYGEVAALIGRPRAVRAVGGACGANPIPVLVPCHRVLAAGGKLGGFSSGLHWKRRLLAVEGLSDIPDTR